MRALRQEAYDRQGLTHREVAVLLGVSGKELSYWCSESDSRREPPLWAIRKLAEHLGRALVVLPDAVYLTPLDVARGLP